MKVSTVAGATHRIGELIERLEAFPEWKSPENENLSRVEGKTFKK
jgi:hypothetical protein